MTLVGHLTFRTTRRSVWKKPGATTVILMPNCSTSVATDRELRRTIGGAVLKPNHTCNRADVDDGGDCRLRMDRQHSAHDVHHTIEVPSKLAFDLDCGHLFKVTKQAVAAVDHDVNAAKLLHRLIETAFVCASSATSNWKNAMFSVATSR